MTDPQTSRTGALIVRSNSARPAIQPDCIEVEITCEASVVVETHDLLAMIDRADPYALRAYLRERSDLIDSPDEIMTVNGANMTAEEALDAIPEADSLEDLDEQPDRDDPTERAQLDRSWSLGRAHELFPYASLEDTARVAAWILEGDAR